MKVLSDSPAATVFFSRNSSFSISGTTSPPPVHKKNQRIRHDPASSVKKYRVYCQSDESVTNRKRTAFVPVNSSRQSAVAEVIQSRNWISAVSR